MKLRKIIRYLEVIDRQLEILYINFSKRFRDQHLFSIFWRELSLEKSNLYSCLSLIEQVGEENLVISEYKEEEFICVMEKLTRYIKGSLEKDFSMEDCMDMAVEIETEHYVRIFNHLSHLVEGDFQQVIKEMNNHKANRNHLRRIVLEFYPESQKKKDLIRHIEKSFSESETA